MTAGLHPGSLPAFGLIGEGKAADSERGRVGLFRSIFAFGVIWSRFFGSERTSL